MGEAEPKKAGVKGERRFSQEQYDMLKRCSEKKDITEWNEWRKKHKKDEVWLEGAPLNRAYLKGANLGTLQMIDEETKAKIFGEVHLNNADLDEAHLENADLQFAHLEDAKLRWAHLEEAGLMNARLQNAKLWFAHLQGADIAYAHVQNAEFQRATVDGSTSLWECKVNRKTNFLGVSLDVAKIDPGTKQLLEYNIRRMNWEDWYGKGRWWARFLKSVFIKPFWLMSDYGMSTLRVVGVFFLLAFLFAGIYVNWAYWRPPGIISNLVVQPEMEEAVWHYFSRALLRPVYFSIVTMTTLGLGDMYANKGSIAGHVILAVQVIFGYVLLGALVTRFAVLFTAGGPAGKFAEEKKKEAQQGKPPGQAWG